MMETETPVSPTAVNPTPTTTPTRQATSNPVMDVVPPSTPTSAEPTSVPPVSEEVAGQMTDPSTPVPPAPAPGPGAAAATPASPVAAPPVDDDTPPPDDGDSPHELIHEKAPAPVEAQSAKADKTAEKPAHSQAPAVQVPHHHDTTRIAIIATVVITIALSMLVVMAYMSSSKA
jgi:hypothetical protein